MSYSTAIEQLKAAIVLDTSLVYQNNKMVEDLRQDEAPDFDGVFQIINAGGGETFREVYSSSPQFITSLITIQVGTTLVYDRDVHEKELEARGQLVIQTVETPRASFTDVVLCSPSSAPRRAKLKGNNRMIWECDFNLIYRK